MCDERYEESSCCAVGGSDRRYFDSYGMSAFMGRAGASGLHESWGGVWRGQLSTATK